MMKSDPLMDAIVAAPDDDAPRLVWADREGGERGELVVVQCALARRESNLSREDRRRLVTRERDLLFPSHAKNASWGSGARRLVFGLLARRQRDGAWSRSPDRVLLRNDLLGETTPRWSPLDGIVSSLVASSTFVRGFVECVCILQLALANKMDELFARVPLLRRLELDTRNTTDAMVEETLARLPQGRITAFSIGGRTNATLLDDAKIIASTSSLRSLRDLGLWSDLITSEAAAVIAHLQQLEALTRLSLQASWDGAGWSELLRALPNLRQLTSLSSDGAFHDAELRTFLRAPELARLSTLEVVTNTAFDDADLKHIAATSSLSNLSQLKLHDSHARSKAPMPKSGVEAIARSPYLTNLLELEMNCIDDDGLAMLARAPFAAHLRVLGLGFGKVSPKSVSTLLQAFPCLERVDIGCTPLGKRRGSRSDLEDVIPTVVHY